jgi:hypothetical protein
MKTIIEMAREAGIIHPEMVDKTLERFAALVEAAARADEREACAKVCDKYNFGQAPKMIQNAIRARGQA